MNFRGISGVLQYVVVFYVMYFFNTAISIFPFLNIFLKYSIIPDTKAVLGRKSEHRYF